jgi:hypothetical protein
VVGEQEVCLTLVQHKGRGIIAWLILLVDQHLISVQPLDSNASTGKCFISMVHNFGRLQALQGRLVWEYVVMLLL